jgi:RNA repair pathway DNA polymerase beta family
MVQKLLFSCQYGSRLYGTQTPTSDLDLKHVYLPALNDLLVGKQLANKVKKTNTKMNTRNGADDVDEEFLPVQVFARDFMMGQTYALELAFAG